MDCDDEFLKEISNSECHIFSLNKKPGNNVNIPLKIARYCRQNNISIIHSLGWATYAEGLIAAKLASKRFIFSYRGKTIEDTVHIPKRRIMAQRFFALLCDQILTNSNVSRQEYAQYIGISAAKISVVYNGVNINKFTPEKSNRSDLKNQLGISDNDIVVGSVARFDPVKNIPELVRAFSGLNKNKHPNCKLLVIGDGPDRKFIDSLIKTSGIKNSVILPGMKRNIPDWLRIMDIYVQPSIFENIPNAILEAMATGLPVVATDVGGVKEVLKEGQTGILVPLGNTKSMTNAIGSLVNDLELRKKMGVQGRSLACTKYSIEKMVSEYENTYKGLLSLSNR